MNTKEIIELVSQYFTAMDENTRVIQAVTLSVPMPHDRGHTEFNAKVYQVGGTFFVADYDDKNNILAWWGIVEMGIEEEQTGEDIENDAQVVDVEEPES